MSKGQGVPFPQVLRLVAAGLPPDLEDVLEQAAAEMERVQGLEEAAAALLVRITELRPTLDEMEREHRQLAEDLEEWREGWLTRK